MVGTTVMHLDSSSLKDEPGAQCSRPGVSDFLVPFKTSDNPDFKGLHSP